MAAPPGDPVRDMRHRLRNDLQTLSSLCRLAARRVPAGELVAVFPQWLDTLAVLQDLPAPGADGGDVPLRPVAEALARRMESAARIAGEGVAPAGAVVAVALGIAGLLAFARNAAGPSGDIRLELTDGPRAVFTPQAALPDEPPLSLRLAAEALDGAVRVTRSGRETIIALTYPCP